jgi:hypothetical protein
MLAAERLRAGRAVGVDLGSSTDQSGDDEWVTLRHAKLEGVQDRMSRRIARNSNSDVLPPAAILTNSREVVCQNV